MAGSDLERSAHLYHLGRTAVEAGDLEKAIGLFKDSVDEHPHFKTLELLGECLLKLGRTQESIVPLAAAVGLNRGVRAAALLGEALLELEQYDHAIDAAEEALRRDSNNRKARTILESLAGRIARRSL